MTTEKKDIVSQLLDQVLELSSRSGGSFDENMALEIERQIRREYGGDEVYIHQHHSRAKRRQAALDEAKKTGKPLEAAKKHGISRASIYRLLNRRGDKSD